MVQPEYQKEILLFDFSSFFKATYKAVKYKMNTTEWFLLSCKLFESLKQNNSFIAKSAVNVPQC